jgi:hypothetical protein
MTPEQRHAQQRARRTYQNLNGACLAGFALLCVTAPLLYAQPLRERREARVVEPTPEPSATPSALSNLPASGNNLSNLPASGNNAPVLIVEPRKVSDNPLGITNSRVEIDCMVPDEKTHLFILSEAEKAFGVYGYVDKITVRRGAPQLEVLADLQTFFAQWKALPYDEMVVDEGRLVLRIETPNKK